MSEETKIKKKVRRPSQAARSEIKKRAAELRKQAQEAAPKQKKVADDKVITFQQWWMKINKKIKLRPHMKEIIWADFKARGAGKMESEERYDELLRIFGYKW